MGLSDLQRIKGPFDQIDASIERLLTLELLELARGTLVSKRPQNRGHVGVQKRLPPVHAGDGKRESDHAVAGKCAQHLPAGFRSYDEKRKRHDIHVSRPPHRTFDFDASSKFRET